MLGDSTVNVCLIYSLTQKIHVHHIFNKNIIEFTCHVDNATIVMRIASVVTNTSIDLPDTQ